MYFVQSVCPVWWSHFKALVMLQLIKKIHGLFKQASTQSDWILAALGSLSIYKLQETLLSPWKPNEKQQKPLVVYFYTWHKNIIYKSKPIQWNLL